MPNPVKMWLSAVLFSMASCHYNAQAQNVLCSGGIGNFKSKFTTGVTVSVNATKIGGLSTRSCEATLTWNQQELMVVPDAWQVDIDVMGADLGLGAPVVAFQIKKTDTNAGMTYEVYSLQSPPRLLRTITGGNSFSTADTDLDGRIEIWTGDARAGDGFESLPLADLDFAPTVVLRFEKQRLIDVSSEFQPSFDRQIAEVRGRLDAQELSDFRNSDGKLSTIPQLPAEQLHRLLRTKIKVLEIVWSYLYSGREHNAWNALAEMWPPADIDRIRAAILGARARGIRAEIDGVAAAASRPRRAKHAQIYNSVDKPVDTEGTSRQSIWNLRTMGNPPATGAQDSSKLDVKPQPIYLRRPPLPDAQQSLPNSGVQLDLVIDAAGKVRSAKLAAMSDKGPLGASLIEASAEWKFIPAFKEGRPVACHLPFILSDPQ
jgi:hypothetical protein